MAESRAAMAAALMSFDEAPDSEREFLHFAEMYAVRLTEWAAEEHYGDCTTVPATCARCLHDDYMQQTEWVIRYLESEHREVGA